MGEQPAPVQTLLAQAIADDVNGLVSLAVDRYEQVLEADTVPVEAYINLACLYWQITDFGFFSFYRDISDALYTRAWDRCLEVLDDTERYFPQHPEVHFWRRYFAWTNLNKPFSDMECLPLAQLPEATQVPFFRLYVPPSPQFRAEAQQLLHLCERQLTAKNRYIVSILRKKLATP